MKATDGFKDNAKSYIIAWDFDGTLTKENKFPRFGQLREYTGEIFAVLSLFGTKHVIWSCRDDEDVQPLIKYLVEHQVPYDSINSSIQFAPFHYEARKIYAHMYVDDRAFGWKEREDIMLLVMQQFLIEVCGFDHHDAKLVVLECKTTNNDPQEWMKEVVKNWRNYE